MVDYKKQCIYFNERMLREIYKEADRLNISVTALIHKCWEMSKNEIKSLSKDNDD